MYENADDYERKQELAHWYKKPPSHCYLYIDSLTCELLTEWGDVIGSVSYRKPYQYTVIGFNNLLYIAKLDRMVYRDDSKRIKGYFLDIQSDEKPTLKSIWKSIAKR